MFSAELSKAGFEQTFYGVGIPKKKREPLQETLRRDYFRGSCRIVDDMFIEAVKRPHLLTTDRVTPHCRRSWTPYVWSCAELKVNEASVYSPAKDFGLNAFLALPLLSPDGTSYGNFTVYCTETRYDAWLQRTKHLSPLLHITAQYLQDYLYTADIAPVNLLGVCLSPRQRECLLWASRGLSSKRIADRLGLSRPVVNEYLGAARRKLCCVTTAQTVARATSLDLIDP